MSPKVSESYKEQKRRDLLEAARRVFIENGYTNATMQDIMDESGISRGGLYSYFHSIDHVFMEVLQSEDEEHILFFEPAGPQRLWIQLTDWLRLQQPSVEGIRYSLVRAKAEFFLSSRYIRDKQSFPYMAERYEQLNDAIRRFIQTGMKQGEFRPQLEPEHIARYFISFLDGLMLDTYQYGADKTKAAAQLAAFEFSLKSMLSPIDAQK